MSAGPRMRATTMPRSPPAMAVAIEPIVVTAAPPPTVRRGGRMSGGGSATGARILTARLASTAVRLLVVTYPFPPMPSTGSNRWTAMTRYLRELGHEVTVLTTAAFGALESDRESDVVRVHDVIANERLRKLLRRPPLPEPGQAAVPDVAPPKLLTDVIVPD